MKKVIEILCVNKVVGFVFWEKKLSWLLCEEWLGVRGGWDKGGVNSSFYIVF